MRRLSLPFGDGVLCAGVRCHTRSLKRARSRVGYVSMPARIHISARRSGVEKHTGDSCPSPPSSAYIEMYRESLPEKDVFDTNLWGRLVDNGGKERGGKFSVVPRVSV